jgi:hypothetical protein
MSTGPMQPTPISSAAVVPTPLELAPHQLGEGAMEAGDGASGKSVAVMVSRPGLVGAERER